MIKTTFSLFLFLLTSISTADEIRPGYLEVKEQIAHMLIRISNNVASHKRLDSLYCFRQIFKFSIPLGIQFAPEFLLRFTIGPYKNTLKKKRSENQ